jgi:hypothetical protein
VQNVKRRDGESPGRERRALYKRTTREIGLHGKQKSGNSFFITASNASTSQKRLGFNQLPRADGAPLKIRFCNAKFLIL